MILIFCTYQQSGYAQLGFCSGNSGDPIFTETFGTGTTSGPALAPGTTTYNFVNSGPNDGSYTVSSTTNFNGWHNTQDHTPNDTNGKSLIINADFTVGEFFRRTVTGLCENTSYEFSAWLLNLLPVSGCGGNGIPINVKFEIWDATDTNLLASGNTGQIANKSSAVWEQYGLVFQTIIGQNSVILKMLNNEIGGCGNDLAIDDIVFKTCGDFITISTSQNENAIEVCAANGAFSTELFANPDFSIYNTHAYQWQSSTDAVNWVDILSATNQSYVTPLLSSTLFYRVKVAENAINLANPLCSSVSEIFNILIVQQPLNPISNGDVEACVNNIKTISVVNTTDVYINWYDALTGGTLLKQNSTFYNPTSPGTYYAEGLSTIGDCKSISRTPVTIQFIDLPVVKDENLSFCSGSSIILSANMQNVSYLWSTGETTENITVTTEGIFTVEVTNSSNCKSTKIISLEQIDPPAIKNIKSNEYDVDIILENQIGNFEYSINGFSYQDSNSFLNLEGGLYIIYVREKSGCGIVTMNYIHLVIPKFFTPNGDGSNDTFDIEGIELYANYEVAIYDRFGKLLKSIVNNPLGWDGTFNNQDLSADDYWYVIRTNNDIFKGHFSLKR
mgnify:FL=1